MVSSESSSRWNRPPPSAATSVQPRALAGLPLRAADRGPEHPLILAGGSGCYNPEPMSAFFDAMVIGEGEEDVVAPLCAGRKLTLGNHPAIFHVVCYPIAVQTGREAEDLREEQPREDQVADEAQELAPAVAGERPREDGLVADLDRPAGAPAADAGPDVDAEVARERDGVHGQGDDQGELPCAVLVVMVARGPGDELGAARGGRGGKILVSCSAG